MPKGDNFKKYNLTEEHRAAVRKSNARRKGVPYGPHKKKYIKIKDR